MTQAAQQLEALLFVAGEAVPVAELRKVLKLSPEEFLTTLHELSGHLAEHGLACVVTGQEAELTTSPALGAWMAQITQQEPAELSRAAAETLALVAYRGPLTRYEIDVIRGVDCRQMLRKLLRQGVIQRLPTRGRAPQYDVTEEFYKQLGVTRRDELPGFQELLNHPSLTSFFRQES